MRQIRERAGQCWMPVRRGGVMGKSVEVIPFFERFGEDEGGWPGESYVAGFRKADGSSAGVEVVLPAELVQHAVLSRSGLSLSMNPDGTFALHAEGLSDDALDAARKGSLAKQSLEALLSECLQVEQVAMDDDPTPELNSLRAQLATGLSLVDRALERLSKK